MSPNFFETFRFLGERSKQSHRALVVMMGISGLSSGLLLGVINHAAESAATGSVDLTMAGVFVLALLAYIVSKTKALDGASRIAERAIRDLRVSMADKIRHSELLFLEKAGKGDIYARLTQDTSTVSQCVPIIFNGYQSSVVVLSALIYVVMVSFDAAIITVVLLAIGGWVYSLRQRQSVDGFIKAAQKEGAFFDSLGHLMDGFKEIKLNHAKNDDVFQRVDDVSRETERVMSTVSSAYVRRLVLSQVFIFLILAALVFILPAMEYSESKTIVKLTAAILFMVSPLEVVLVAWHFQTRTKVALDGIRRLETLLGEREDKEGQARPDPARFAGFSSLRLQDVVFAYPDSESAFQIGPLSVEIPRGKCTFVIGGNGGGKSTFLKVLTGLYPPQRGRLSVDGHVISAESMASYRELFACVFADFHLFDRLYGLKNADPREVLRLIDRMGLADKTSFRDGRFTNLDLSTGQRKRLALIAALLEDKPVYVFDEWAADQDKEFRRSFYAEIVPELLAQGKTVIAVTHDDRWFHACDQLLKLDYGSLSRVDLEAL